MMFEKNKKRGRIFRKNQLNGDLETLFWKIGAESRNNLVGRGESRYVFFDGVVITLAVPPSGTFGSL